VYVKRIVSTHGIARAQADQDFQIGQPRMYMVMLDRGGANCVLNTCG
jgi:hypothetical protein